MEVVLLLLVSFSFVATVVCCILLLRLGRDNAQVRQLRQELLQLRSESAEQARQSRQENSQVIQQNVRLLGEMLSSSQSQSGQELAQRQEALQKTVLDMMRAIDVKLTSFTMQSEQKMEGIRTTMENRLALMQEDNGRRLEQMRATVDEKLQKTLEERIGQSFQLVSQRLEQVYKGLGEMQTLAAGVGDLKKVLSNVKTRGVLGEIQLGAILEELLSPEQYEANVPTKKGSQAFVEYAIRLPGEGEAPVYLPVDAKFPADAYAQLLDAYDAGDSAQVEAAAAVLERRIKQFGKDIRDRYIDPPNTTDFAIMFLPFEGLYAEVVRRGMAEALQRDYKICIAGPTTMAALLNSLQMGFRTLAIQKRSSEVWDVLGAVKTEFDKFAGVLATARQRLEQADNELEKLVGTRTRMIQRKLRTVSSMPEAQSIQLLESAEE